MEKTISKIIDIVIGTAVAAGSFVLVMVVSALPFVVAILIVIWIMSMF